MLDLPKATHFGRIIPKDKIYAHGGADTDLKDAFAEQVERIRWLYKISPATANITRGEQVEEIQVIEVSLTTPVPDKRILPTILKAIQYKLVFALVHGGKTTYTVYYDNKTLFSSDKPPKLVGNDTDSVWENIVVQIKSSAVAEGKTLDEQIAADKERGKLEKRIAALEKKLLREKQFNRQVELNGELKRLRKELEGLK